MFVSLLRSYAAANPCKLAVVCKGESISYGEMDQQIKRAGKNLMTIGFNRGSVVVISFNNSIEYLILYYALAEVGAVVVPVSPTTSMIEIAEICRECRPDYYLVQDSLTARYEQICGDLQSGMVVSEHTRPYNLEYLFAKDRPTLHHVPYLLPDYDFLVTYHAGLCSSQGRAKGAVQTHKNHIQRALNWCRTGGLCARDRTLCIHSLTEAFTMELFALPALSTGQTLFVMDNTLVNVEAVAEMIRRERITVFGAVPSLYEQFLSLSSGRGWELTSLRIAVCPTTPRTEELTGPFQEHFGIRLNSAYGRPETSVLMIDLEGSEDFLSIGTPVYGVEARIRNLDLGLENAGELYVKSDGFAERYLGDHDPLLDSDGWLATGDLVHKMNGKYYMLGRMSEAQDEKRELAEQFPLRNV